MQLNNQVFFQKIRPLFGNKLTEGQVSGMEALLLAAPASLPLDRLAYVLATTFHETGRAMQPVTENLNYTTAKQIKKTWNTRFATEADASPYVKNPQALANFVYASRMGNGPPASGHGWKYRGRGDAQITGLSNYTWASEETGVDLVADPDRANDPAIAAQILYSGMINGKFTGKRLDQYFGGTPNPVGARAIINPDGNGPLIEGYWKQFLAALKAATQDAVETNPAPAANPVRIYMVVVLEDGRLVESYQITPDGQRLV